MNRSLLSLAMLFLTLLAAPLAAEEPQAVLQKIMNRLKQTGDPRVVMEYVDWQTQFNRLTPEQRQAFAITSPAEYRAFAERALTNPSSEMRGSLKKELAGAKPEDQKIADDAARQVEATFNQRREEVKRDIMAADYRVGAAKITGSTAKVELTTTLRGESSTSEVDFIRVGDRWLLAQQELSGK